MNKYIETVQKVVKVDGVKDEKQKDSAYTLISCLFFAFIILLIWWMVS